MDASLPLTALILTYNEEANISRTLAALEWVPRVLVIDSGSSDGTLDLLSRHPSVTILHRPFDTFAAQCNFGLEIIHTPWVLSLDADYVVTPALATEIMARLKDPRSETMAGFSITFRYCIAGRPLRGSLLPPRTCLYRPERGRYRDEGHGHRLVLEGTVERLRASLLHDDRKPLQRWLTSQQRYQFIEARNLRATPSRSLSKADLLRKHTFLAPFAALLLCLVWQQGLFDGRRGWAYALQRMYAELLLCLFLMEARFQEARPAATLTLPPHAGTPT